MQPHHRRAPALPNVALVDKLAARWRRFEADDPRELERVMRFWAGKPKGDSGGASVPRDGV